jgi:nucleotide-binding universal stress UspA family protein
MNALRTGPSDQLAFARRSPSHADASDGLIRKILVAISAVPAEKEVEFVADIARPSRPKVFLLHVREYPFKGSEWLLGGSWLVEKKTDAYGVLLDTSIRFARAGSDVQIILRAGRHDQVPSIIASTGKQIGADLIVMGFPAHPRLDELFEGKMIPKVRRMTDVPLLTIPERRLQRGEDHASAEVVP